MGTGASAERSVAWRCHCHGSNLVRRMMRAANAASIQAAASGRNWLHARPFAFYCNRNGHEGS